jgi:hypothetical protein
LVSLKGDNSESWITFWIVKAVLIFPNVSLTAQELSGKLFGEIPRVTYPLKPSKIITFFEDQHEKLCGERSTCIFM